MAGVRSLCIRGIRSFGPDDGDEQQITFSKPLTLILGQNGCGKTTIIECLRYAITGQMPPGSRNECFVFDAKVNKSSEVNAQVKLKIVNGQGQEFKVSRSMQVTCMKTKSKFATKDAFMSVIDDKGQEKHISTRCADLDFMINEQLGVPKAIINSVIFCHQEDSSWPLDEGKKVKERFDEIFDADKYGDCFDKLKKLRKEYATTIKLLDMEVKNLSEKKDELDKKKLDVVNTESKIMEGELKMGQLTKELKPITEKLKAIESIQMNLVNFESKREKVKNRLENYKSQEQELTNSIKTLFTGSTDDLKQNINSYETQAATKHKRKIESEKRVNSLNSEENSCMKEISSSEVQFNRLMLLETQHQERVDQRNTLISDTATLAEIKAPDDLDKPEQATKAIKALSQKLQAHQQELTTLRTNADTEEKKLQRLVDDSRDALARHKQKIVSKDTELRDVRKDIEKMEREIMDANESKMRLESLENKLKNIESEYENAQTELNSDECQSEINEDEKVLDQLDHESEELNKKITKLQKQSAKLAEKDVIEESLKTKENAFTVLKNKHKSNLIELLNRMPEKGFTMAVKEFECTTRAEVTTMRQEVEQKNIKVTSLEAERRHLKELLNSKRNELTNAEERMYKACGTQTYNQALAKTNAQVDKFQDEQNTLKSQQVINKKYKEKLQEFNCCPLCNRGFDSQSEVTTLITDLETTVINVPAKLEKVSEALSRVQEKRDELLSLKSLNDKIESLKEIEIPQLEKRISKLDQDLSTTSTEIEELSMSLMEPEQRLQTAQQLQSEMPLLDRYVTEIQSTTKDLQALKEHCIGIDGDMNLDVATATQSSLRLKINSLRTRIKTNQVKLNNHTKKLQNIMQRKNQLKEELLNIQKKVQEVCKLQDNLKQLESNREKFILELKQLRDSTGLLESELQDKEQKKTAAVSKNRNALDTKRQFIVKLESSIDKIKSIDKQVTEHEKKNVRDEMNKIKDRVSELKSKKQGFIDEKLVLAEDIERLKDELAKQEIYKRDLEDNLKLRKVREEKIACETDIEAINASVSGINVDMLADKESLIRRQTQIFSERANTDGRIIEQKERLQRIKEELQMPNNKNLEIKYREKFYDLHILQAIDKDVKDYSAAMEKCLMQFHKEKMENINLIIREMWRKIYRGNDIDYIEIKTEGNFTDIERRKYDYRVVQCKNGVEIDMRGRCSAGQKVLACLIIRLALAETFSTRFGVLALDEPTTNLDQDNIRSLCSALGEIVQERMREKNFMFIIITHDREFIESLGAIDKVTHYYEVSRNDEGKSRVKKIRFS